MNVKRLWKSQDWIFDERVIGIDERPIAFFSILSTLVFLPRLPRIFFHFPDIRSTSKIAKQINSKIGHSFKQ